ncbi:MAG: hypothetical protein WBG91_19250, partial [Syntrophobacteria bacterium]
CNLVLGVWGFIDLGTPVLQNTSQSGYLPTLIACNKEPNSAPGEITVQVWGFHQISPAGKQPSNYLT